jgi:nucleoid DNA-binding protein
LVITKLIIRLFVHWFDIYSIYHSFIGLPGNQTAFSGVDYKVKPKHRCMITTWKTMILWGCLAASGMLMAPKAQAQQSVDLIMDNFTSSVLSQTTVLLNNNALEASMRNARNKKAGKTAAGVGAASARKLNLAYTPSAALQQQTVQNLVTKMQSKNAQAAQAVNNALGSGKASYGQLFSELVRESGLPANNAATALAAYLEIGYMIVNNVQTGITPVMDRALQQQSAGILSQNRNLTSPATIAKLGEELKLQAIVLYLGWQSTLKNPVQLPQFRSGIAQQFKAMGLDMSKVKLTENGFGKRS